MLFFYDFDWLVLCNSAPIQVYRALVNTDGDESEKPNNLKLVQNRADALNRQKRIDQDLLVGVLRLSPVLIVSHSSILNEIQNESQPSFT